MLALFVLSFCLAIFGVAMKADAASAPAIEWQKILGGSNDDYAESIQQTSDGGYIIAGYSNSSDGDVTGNDGSSWDYWVVKLNGSGAIEWEKNLGGSWADYAESIQQTTDGGYIVAGYSNSSDGNVTGHHGSYDYWIVKLGPDGSSGGPVIPGGLKVDVLERGSANMGSTFAEESTSRTNGGNLICVAPSDPTSPYLDSYGNPVSELGIFTADENLYSKKGLTADGNTRLILRAQTTGPCVVRFSIPAEIGATLEHMTIRYRGTSDHIDVIAQKITDNIYQATAVLIAPNGYPEVMKSSGMPEYPFTLSVTATPDDPNNAPVTKTTTLSLHLSPVVLVHGIIGYGKTQREQPGYWHGSNVGIYDQLARLGDYKVYECNYEAWQGPTGQILNLRPNETSDLFRTIANALRAENRDGIACTRADLVVHSMGGLMARAFMAYDPGYKNSIRAYKQGLVRRLITVATPHQGAPGPNYMMGDLDALYQDRADSAIAGLLLTQSARDMITRFGFSYFDADGDYVQGCKDLALNSALLRNLPLPSVPTHAIYGKIKNEVEFMDSIADTIAFLISMPQDWVMGNIVNAADALVTDPFLSAVLQTETSLATGSLADHIAGIEDFLEVLYGDDDYDIAVSAQSAAGSFAGTSTPYEGLRYNHGGLLEQPEVGKRVLTLLWGDDTLFKKFQSASSAAAAAKSPADIRREADVLAKKLIAAADESLVENALTMTADATSGKAPFSIKFTVTTDRAVDGNMVLKLEDGQNVRLIGMAKADEGKYEVTVRFTDEVSGAMNASCWAFGGGKSFVSEKTDIFIAPELAGLKDVRFADSGELSAFVGEKTAFSLLGELENGEVRVISSPVCGTSYSVGDPVVAKVDGDGLLVGLSEGVTTLTAANGGLQATINVAVARNIASGAPVNPANPDNPDDPDNSVDPDGPGTPIVPDNPDDPNNPDNPNNPNGKQGGGGCNASALGFGALVFAGLILKKKSAILADNANK
jgi:pimeloyl-ACP methyl ester carboxylesterase